MNEGQYLELCNNLKELFNKKDEQNKVHIIKYNELYKTLCIVYGLIRVYQNNDDDLSFQHLIDEIRAICSQSLFTHLQQVDYD